MMRALVALCVRHSGAVTALTVLALLLGSWGALHSPLDVFPEFVPTQVDVQTEAPGFAPQQVEELVTKPIENAVNGTAGLETLRSESITELADAARTALPLRGAGFIDLASQRVLIRSPTPAPDIAALGAAVVTVRDNTPILLRDLAEVKMAPALRFGDALIMGKPGVLLSLASQYGANTLATTLAVERALAALEPALRAQGITLYPDLHRPANFIERALGNLQESLLLAAVLILAVLYAFLRDVRAAFIAFTAIPLSLLAAVAVLNHMGLTLNTMTLGGFAVALGVLVDDAIIGIENILRRLRENVRLEAPRPRLEIIREASLEVRGPVIYATAVVVVVFLPELFTSSVQGRFVGPLALAFIFAVLASLVVAMTSTPALCALLLRRHDERPEAEWLQRLKSWQRWSVERVSRHLRV